MTTTYRNSSSSDIIVQRVEKQSVSSKDQGGHDNTVLRITSEKGCNLLEDTVIVRHLPVRVAFRRQRENFMRSISY